MLRREFLHTSAIGLPFAGSSMSPVAVLRALEQASKSRGGEGQERPLVIDGLGEIRLDYQPELLDEIIGSGMRRCL